MKTPLRLCHAPAGVAVGHKDILIVVRALFQRNGNHVRPPLIVVEHLVVLGKAVVGQVAVQIDLSAFDLWHVELEMCDEIVALCGVIHVVAVAHEETAVLVLIVDVVAALLVGHDCGMIIWLVVAHALHVHRRHILIKNLKTAVFVAGGEYQIPVVLIKQLGGAHITRTPYIHTCVPTAVLKYHWTEFLLWPVDIVVEIIDADAHLLMTGILVDVGVWSDGQRGLYTTVQYREAGACNRLVVAVLHDIDDKIAAHL